MTNDIIAPTCEEITDDDMHEKFKSVHRESDDSWRHGCYITQVFQRLEDGTYWRVNYRLSHDGETNELTEGYAKISQVVPVEKTIISYVAVKKDAE